MRRFLLACCMSGTARTAQAGPSWTPAGAGLAAASIQEGNFKAQLLHDPSGRHVRVQLFIDRSWSEQAESADAEPAAPGAPGDAAEDVAKRGAKRSIEEANFDAPVSWQEAIEWLQGEPAMLRELLSRVLSEMPFQAFFWECPAVSQSTAAHRHFEFMVLQAAHLQGIRADPEPFAEHLDAHRGQEVARTFANLGGDSWLVAPAWATDDPQVYAHAANFFTKAPTTQQLALLQELGHSLSKRLHQEDPRTYIWVSTEGSGVYWLHVRLDPRPKYYHHGPYRNPNYSASEEL